MLGDAPEAYVGDFNRLWREVKLIAHGVQPEYVKRGGYLSAGCKTKLVAVAPRMSAQEEAELVVHACHW